MHRLHPSRHAIPAVLAVVAALVAPLFAGPGATSGTAGSAVARAAVNEDVIPAPAPEARFAIGGPAMAAARQIAEQHWGTPPCGGNIVIAWAQLDEETNATAAWRNPTDAWNNAGENFDCHIEFNARSDFDWPKLCTVMTHEVGHLVGQPHADIGGQLMSPVYSEPLPACTGAEPGAPAPVATPEPEVAEETVVALRASKTAAKTKKKAAAKKKPLRAGKKKPKGSKRCTRRFRAGRKALRCGKPHRAAGRAVRARR